MIVTLLIIGILSASVWMRFRDISDEARYAATYEHLQRLAEIADRFRLSNGRWPDDAYPNIIPDDLKKWCSPSDFGLSKIDGYFDWNGPNGTTSPYYGIAIVRWSGSGAPKEADMLAIDVRFDDGDLSSGHIQKVKVGSRQVLHYVLADAD